MKEYIWNFIFFVAGATAMGLFCYAVGAGWIPID